MSSISVTVYCLRVWFGGGGDAALGMQFEFLALQNKTNKPHRAVFTDAGQDPERCSFNK